MHSLLIILPSQDESGPVKGGLALAEGLSSHFNVHVVFLKGRRINAEKSGSSVRYTHIKGGLLLKIIRLSIIKWQYRKSLSASLSICFSADMVNLLAWGKCAIATSIRGNLFKNYYYDYGLVGKGLAYVHMYMASFFNRVVVLNESALIHYQLLTGRNNAIIARNFINEEEASNRFKCFRASLEEEKPKRGLRLCYLGSLTQRKRVDLVIKAIYHLRTVNSMEVTLNIMGEGPLKRELWKIAENLGVLENINFLGHVSDPFKVLCSSDILALPSLSEGTSRASLEALYVGTRCILRNVDSNGILYNRELGTGITFEDDDDFLIKLLELIQMVPIYERRCLLPAEYRQSSVCAKIASDLRSLK